MLVDSLLLMYLAVLTDSRLVYRTPTRIGRSQQEIITNNVQDIYQTTTDFIEATGLIAETHEVVTEDGYILNVHRLPSPTLNKERVVVLLHGLAASSDNWLLYTNKSFPYILHMAGYDVWIGSYRGSTYSRRHIKYQIKDNKYWDYSIHEMGVYDTPAFIDVALNVTEAEKVFLIGHSRGTTSSYILLSSRPEYNDKVKLVLSFAPVACPKHASSKIISILFREWTVRQARRFQDITGLHGFGTITSNFSRDLRLFMCNGWAILNKGCLQGLELLLGPDYLNEQSKLRLFLSHYPDGVSTTELLHFLQLAKTDKFRPYDYGSESLNLAKYNMTSPAEYNLQNIRAPVSLYYARLDLLSTKKDVLKLAPKLPNLAGVFKVPHRLFNHVNFIVGNISDNVLYRPTIAFMESFLHKID